ncbi:hypothetical protein K435DRAFT_973196 [Dendrothele bispora CBS 962.96]|uniref:Uncharacterized protein n=1 Tax=Dendrothele bispora (strain CBS 962.96) TaxID=1314807 RepID=A0A4S8KU14_DENBC|nr:hypothetical protein K435DRAFT_973196 [Dendrothele bispora CBS 962.96]
MTTDVDRRSQLDDLVGTMEDIADMFPNLGKLELITNVWTYDDMIKYTVSVSLSLSFSKSSSFVLIPSTLHRLRLALDFERGSNDELDEDRIFKWYNRCLHRRHAATANICPITRCYWLHQFKGSEGNERLYHLIVENDSSAAGRPGASDSSRSEGQTGSRVVKAKKSWWMEPDWDGSVIEDLPCEAVGTSAEDYATSDSDESVSRR